MSPVKRGGCWYFNGVRLRRADCSSRKVYIGGGYVLKFNDAKLYKQNPHEARKLRRLAKTKDAKHFPRLIAWAPRTYEWIVVTRFTPLSHTSYGRDGQQHEKTLNRLKRLYKLHDIDFPWHNCGLCKGELVIYDLGYTPECTVQEMS